MKKFNDIQTIDNDLYSSLKNKTILKDYVKFTL